MIEFKKLFDFKNPDKLVSYVFYAFFFLLPFFYVPKLNVTCFLNQKALAVAFVFVLFVLWLIRAIKNKKIVLEKSLIQLFLVGFLIFSFVSASASKNVFQSFWGRANSADTFLMFGVYFLIFFFSANLLKTKDQAINVFKSFIAGSMVLALLFLVDAFTKIHIGLFTPVEPFSIIFALALSCVVALAFRDRENFSSRAEMIIGSVVAIILLIAICLIYYKLAWFFAALAAFLIFWRQSARFDFNFKTKKVLIPAALTLFFLFLFFLPSPISHNFGFNREEPLPYRLGMDISQKTLAESTKNIFLGSGPATFLYEYSLHKDRALGVTDVVYTQGPMGIITIASSVGVIAVLFLLAAWLFFIIKGFLFLLADVDHRTKKASDEDELKSILFPIGFSLFATLFFYRLTIVPLAVSFLILGLWAGMLNNKETEFEINADIKSKDKKPLTATIILALVALIIIFGAFMFKSQYIAEALYQRSFKAYNTLNQNSYKKEDLDYPIKLADMAVDIFPNSDYYVGLSQLYIIKASKAFEESSSAGQTSEAKTANENEARNLASQAESLAKIATAREPQNFKTWANLGLIYENTSFLIDDKTKAAIDAYEMAKKLAPNNYEIYFAEGRIYEKKGDKENAIKNYEQALSLNPGLTELTAEIETLKK